MSVEKFNKALDHIDYDLVDEFVKEKEAVQKRKTRRKHCGRQKRNPRRNA